MGKERGKDNFNYNRQLLLQASWQVLINDIALLFLFGHIRIHLSTGAWNLNNMT